MTTKKKTYTFQTVIFDETENWNLTRKNSGALVDYIKKDGRFWGKYIACLSERVRLCEITPSYYLMFAGNQIPFTGPYDELPGEVQNKVSELEHGSHEENIYVHCHTIDNLPEDRKGKPWTVEVDLPDGVESEDDLTDEQLMTMRNEAQDQAVEDECGYPDWPEAARADW